MDYSEDTFEELRHAYQDGVSDMRNNLNVVQLDDMWVKSTTAKMFMRAAVKANGGVYPEWYLG